MSVRIVVSVTEIAEMDPKDRYVVDNVEALSTASEDIGDGIQAHDNDTSNPPVDSVYMICGVLIAMVLVGVIIVLLAVTISKLRKREDHSNAVHPEPAVVQTATPGNNVVSTASVTTTTGPAEGCCTQTTVVTTTTTAVVTMDNHNKTEEPDPIFTTTATAEQFIWQFPPPYPPPNTPPPQYTLYNDQDTLVHGLSSDRQGFAKGFRKNLGGRWRRLVKRKPETDTCAFPPELKDQLKTIYVY
ncbi:lysine-specific demethylase 6B isoform X2 [Belonocnema kinseyi]|uniref:lysine-specific demethylase 6B isoform X2 n=1 Tax=Belonocnema kinseyi TaxID=2817044 RepID=UPI00143D0348|nr:lysine-specific demethylase 6B isoform X2 [Belonocnema kinseyi]